HDDVARGNEIDQIAKKRVSDRARPPIDDHQLALISSLERALGDLLGREMKIEIGGAHWSECHPERSARPRGAQRRRAGSALGWVTCRSLVAWLLGMTMMLKKAWLSRLTRRRVPEVSVRERRGDAPARRSLKKSMLHEEGLVHLFDRRRILADRRADVVQ